MRHAAPLLILALMLATPAAAQDVVGFYFDTDGAATTTTTSAPGQYVQGWLILQGASGTGGLGSWRAEVRIELEDGSPATAQWLYLGGAQNFDAPPSFDVATFTLMPWEQDLALATVLIQVPDPDETVRVYLAGHRFPILESPATFPVHGPEYGHGAEYTPAAMASEAGNTYLPVAVINDDGATPPEPTVLIHWTGENNLYVGMQAAGTVSVRGLELVRPLEGDVAFQDPNMELRRVPVDGGYSGDPSDWTTGTVTSRLEVPPLDAEDRFEYRLELTEAGTQNLGVTFTTGDAVHTFDHAMTVWPTPCSESAQVWGTDALNDLVDGSVMFPSAVSGYPDPSGYVSVRNLGTTELVVTPVLTGSSAFTITNPETATVPPQVTFPTSHAFDVVFAPNNSGWHEAILSFEGDVCGSVTLQGYAVAVSDAGDVPGVTRLLPAYPNPFNPTTTVSFELAKAGRAKVSVYSLDGRLVTVLADEDFAAGTVRREWSGRDARGRTVASGVYLVRLEAGDARAVQRVTLLK